MSKKKGDALAVLVDEVARLIESEREWQERIDTETEMFVRARQALDEVRAKAGAVSVKLATTHEALRLIALRDEVSEETVETLIKQAAQ